MNLVVNVFENNHIFIIVFVIYGENDWPDFREFSEFTFIECMLSICIICLKNPLVINFCCLSFQAFDFVGCIFLNCIDCGSFHGKCQENNYVVR